MLLGEDCCGSCNHKVQSTESEREDVDAKEETTDKCEDSKETPVPAARLRRRFWGAGVFCDFCWGSLATSPTGEIAAHLSKNARGHLRLLRV